ncbi:MAG: hypothetical protein J0L70_00025 [Leptolyngbya sp. UWPOB_LEPTO1]|uniref:hypothetical protein n=1 Tax=Leptolyngbya sp. UWPOB_LEPTO1 TaxID=2815653 RepID=UPI001AD5527A|nr:hypothetical protein [Leptolyngbya sp. UWPOB_LEPTO1]MBN8558890.1 hypothetical protein [Leptolyngbya sp. UWPOB_LEPTO1]
MITGRVVALFTSDQNSHKSQLESSANKSVNPNDSSAIAVLDKVAISDEKISPLFQVAKPSSTAKWVWLTVLVSLGLHVGLMLIPTGNEPKPTPLKEQEKQVRVTQLPTLNKTAVIKAPPKPLTPTQPQRITPVRETTIPPVASPVDRPKPPIPQSPTKPAETKPAESDSNNWADFPIYPTAQPGCFGLQSCLQTSDALAKVSDFFTKELAKKKYESKLTVQSVDRAIYQVSRNGQAQFLSILQSEKGTVYVLADAPRTLEDLKKAVEVPPEVSEILSNLDAQAADPTLFAQPTLFYDRQVQKAGIRNISLVASQADTMMDEYFRSNLQNNGYEVTDLPQQYGGGSLYQVKKGSVTLYLNLVPTKDGANTLVVAWKNLPV